MVNFLLPWLQEQWFFGFIPVKTMADFRKGTCTLRENIRCVGGGEIQKVWKPCNLEEVWSNSLASFLCTQPIEKHV